MAYVSTRPGLTLQTRSGSRTGDGQQLSVGTCSFVRLPSTSAYPRLPLCNRSLHPEVSEVSQSPISTIWERDEAVADDCRQGPALPIHALRDGDYGRTLSVHRHRVDSRKQCARERRFKHARLSVHYVRIQWASPGPSSGLRTTGRYSKPLGKALLPV